MRGSALNRSEWIQEQASKKVNTLVANCSLGPGISRWGIVEAPLNRPTAGPKGFAFDASEGRADAPSCSTVGFSPEGWRGPSLLQPGRSTSARRSRALHRRARQHGSRRCSSRGGQFWGRGGLRTSAAAVTPDRRVGALGAYAPSRDTFQTSVRIRDHQVL